MPHEYVTLLPCFHTYLAVHYTPERVVAVCKRCKHVATHTTEEWAEWKGEGRGLDKPVRV